jgi:phosphopentomutase
VAAPGAGSLDVLRERGVAVHAVGKVGDLFAGRGIDRQHAGATNADALANVDGSSTRWAPVSCSRTSSRPTRVYGHRKDREGFHAALREGRRGDRLLATGLREGDLLVITADHGVDMDASTPTTPASTRSCSPSDPASSPAATTGPSPTSERPRSGG